MKSGCFFRYRHHAFAAAAVAAAMIAVLCCARLKRTPSQQWEGGGVRAWVIRPGETVVQGPTAAARPGDFALSDGALRVVVSRTASGGQWVDVGRTADHGWDYVRFIAPIYDQQAELPYVVQSVEVEAPAAPENAPVIVIRAADRKRLGLQMTTRLEILPASHTVVMTSTLANRSSDTLAPLTLGDRIGWATDNVFIPYYGNLWRPANAEAGGDYVTWLCAWQDNFTLGLTPSEGGMRVVFGKNDAAVIYREAKLGPGAEVSWRRYFPVGDRQMSAVAAFAARLRGAALGSLEGEVRETGSAKPVAGCRVEVLSSARLPAPLDAKPLMWAYTDAQGQFKIPLPGGRYFVWTEKAVARRGPGTGTSQDVTSGAVTRLSQPLQVSPEVVLQYEIRDGDTQQLLPAKLRFEPFPNVPPLDFGNESRGPAARNVVYSATGAGSVTLSAGRYRVVASRGPEYDAQAAEIEVAYTTNNRAQFTLKRIFRMENYVSLDIGVRTSASANCCVSPRDRVIAAAAEGLDALVSGDVGTATDLNEAIAQAGLGQHLSAICGRRAEWFGPNDARGEALIFPCKPGHIAATQLAREQNATAPGDFLRALRQSAPRGLIVLCRPLDPVRGYLHTLGFSIDLARPFPQLPPEASGFDLMEVMTSDDRQLLENRQMLARWMRERGRMGLSAGSDSRFLYGEECGYPRVYVERSPKAGPALFDQIRDALTSGSVLVTNGPFIRLLVNGRGPGSFIKDGDGQIDLLLEVRAAPWVDVRTVAVFDGEFPVRQLILPSSTRLQRFPRQENDSPEFSLPIKHDVIISAQAAGQNPLLPAVAQDELRGHFGFPFAITGPIYVDFDGDGKCTPPNLYEQAVRSQKF
ncbi:MAG: hypothetical protein N3D11_11140 [Candidatus Sumerlaeia bacterium]|nr:hypothetical protein [Candidatus Sumerlaeia bacterium]